MEPAEPLRLARSRAERYLAALALRPRDESEHLPPGLDRGALEAENASRLHVALTTYGEVALVGAADAAVWREAAAGELRPAQPERSSAEALAMLERRWAQLEAAGDSEDELAARQRVSTGLFAVTLAGALSREDARAWRARIDERAAGPDPVEQRRLELMRATRLDDLRRVIAGPVRGPSGLTLVSADIFADGIAIHWRHGRGPRDPGDDPGLDVSLGSLADDVGTDYLSLGGSGQRGGEDRTGTAVFSPAPPADAKRIRVLATAGDEIELTLDAEDGAGR